MDKSISVGVYRVSRYAP